MAQDYQGFRLSASADSDTGLDKAQIMEWEVWKTETFSRPQ